MDLAISSGLIHVPEKLKKDWSPVLAVFDGRYARHLEGVFHLESSKRAQAMESILRDQAVKDRWSALVPRPAALEELAYVHTARYIDQIASTAGRPLMSLDLDTQTSERTFEVARLAVGGVFRLLDEIQAGPPPGDSPWSGPRGTMPGRTRPWATASSTTRPWGPGISRKSTAWSGS